MKFKKVAFILTLISTPIAISSCGNTVIEKKQSSLFLNYDESKGTVEADSYNGFVGDTITLTITPKTNYSVNEVKYNGLTIEVNNNTCSIVFANEGKNEVTITFKTNYDEGATHDGTASSPYTVKEANAIITNLGTGSSSTTLKDSSASYTYGVITSIDNVSTSYGNATFNIKSDNEEIIVWRAYDLGNVKFTDENAIKVGDEVVVYGTLMNYQTKYEISDKPYIYTLNGSTTRDNGSSGDNTGDNTGGNTGDNTDTYDEYGTHEGTASSPYSVKEANDVIDGLGTGSSSTELDDTNPSYTYGVVSSITEISTQYGNGTFKIKSADEEIIVWRAKDLGNVKFTDSNAVKVGDKVIIYGTLMNYKTTYEIGGNPYIYSLNGKTGSSSSGGSDSSSSGGSSSGSTDSGSSSSGTISGSDYPSDPGTYYSSITDDMTGGENGTLRQTLTTLCKPKASYEYSGTGSNSLAILFQSTNEDPNNSENMIYFYTQKSVKKNAAQTWNREHTWPQSLSGGLYGTDGAGCDALHIMPTYNATNSIRGNLKYANCTNGTVENYDGVDFAKTSGGYFEPMDSVKGDCARIILYMYTVYFIERGTPITNVCDSVKTMIQWSKLDPVSEIEVNRNDKVAASKQKNRNPYVDHPEWIDKVFGSSN